MKKTALKKQSKPKSAVKAKAKTKTKVASLKKSSGTQIKAKTKKSVKAKSAPKASSIQKKMSVKKKAGIVSTKQKKSIKTATTADVKSKSNGNNKSPKVGDKIKPFTLPDSVGREVNLSEFKGKRIVLFFYPKDNTPGCTMESQQFSQMHKEFEKLNTVVFGVSKDSVKSHDNFKCKYNFNFELLSDESGELCEYFDVIKEKNMYGKSYLGIERSTFIIGEDQQLLAEYRKVSPDQHAKDILEKLRTNSY